MAKWRFTRESEPGVFTDAGLELFDDGQKARPADESFNTGLVEARRVELEAEHGACFGAAYVADT